MSRQTYAFHLLELSVALTLIAILAVVSVPVLTKASDRARAEACFDNLQQIGQKFARDLQTTGAFPELTDARQSGDTQQCLTDYLSEDSARLTRCPSDEADGTKTATSSYRWFETWNGLSPGGHSQTASLPLLIERENFHDVQSNGRAALLLFRDSPTHTRLSTQWINGETYAPLPLGN